ncbi:MAG: GlsB/YeaQ/YmgE family stress response membrane protein [Pseudoclavibacter sp.]
MLGLSFIPWLIVGLIAGALAKLVLPGKQGGGFWLTLLLGVIGSVVGGLIASIFWNPAEWGFWNFWTWLWAVVGSVLVLVIWGFIQNQLKKRRERAESN